MKKISDNKYEFNFIKTSSKDWYEYIYAILDGQTNNNKISLYTIVKPITNDNDYRDITFDYYFTGPNIPDPE